MKVRQHGSYGIESIAGRYRQIGNARLGHDAAPMLRDRVLESPRSCRSDRDDPSIVTQCGVKDVSRVAMNLVLLGPDRVVRKIIDADRFERTVTDMKRDLGGRDSTPANGGEDLFCKMKAGGRGCDRAA